MDTETSCFRNLGQILKVLSDLHFWGGSFTHFNSFSLNMDLCEAGRKLTVILINL